MSRELLPAKASGVNVGTVTGARLRLRRRRSSPNRPPPQKRLALLQ
jgi:hypothetical protein